MDYLAELRKQRDDLDAAIARVESGNLRRYVVLAGCGVPFAGGVFHYLADDSMTVCGKPVSPNATTWTEAERWPTIWMGNCHDGCLGTSDGTSESEWVSVTL